MASFEIRGELVSKEGSAFCKDRVSQNMRTNNKVLVQSKFTDTKCMLVAFCCVY